MNYIFAIELGIGLTYLTAQARTIISPIFSFLSGVAA